MFHSDEFLQDKAFLDEGLSIGAGTRVWGFIHLVSGAQIGGVCNICEQVLIDVDSGSGCRGAQLFNLW